MSERRNAYGIPVPPSVADLLPILFDDGEPQEADTWREELPVAERSIFDAVMTRVHRAAHDCVPEPDIALLVEETLYQLGRLARQGDAIDLPGAGRWRRVTP